MTWVNLNDVYVSKSGGTISGDLKVDGTLTINDKTGNGTTYDVANQISTLRDSVSQYHTGEAVSVTETSAIGSGSVSVYRCGNVVTVCVAGSATASAWSDTVIATGLPKPAIRTILFCTYQSAPGYALHLVVNTEGKLYVLPKNSGNVGGWIFGGGSYITTS